MFYDEIQATKACEEDPSLIYELIKEGHMELVGKLLKKKIVSINTKDKEDNTVLMKLAKLKQYDMVLDYINDLDYDINHQNSEGNTIMHILAKKDYVYIANIIKKLKRNKKFSPNLRNNDGDTILDIAIKHNNLSTTLKLLEDKRFNNIDLISFNNLYNTFIKNENFGKYTKLLNLETIINELSKKTKLLPRIQELINTVKSNFEMIKNELMSNKLTLMDHIMKNIYMEVAV